jgi:NAD(P)-dependent dehydrogenase (short-subunit alcohol dehydrogenase family)
MSASDAPLAGKTALVTGAGTGIGRASATALSRAGARVALVGRRESALAETARECRAADRDVLLHPADVSDRASVDRAVGRAIEEWGRLDILVANAGINTRRRSMAEITPEEWDDVIAVNLTGVYNAVRAALPHLRSAGDGLVIVIGSTAALGASKLPGIAYTASKHALVGFTATLRIEEREHGLRATAIHPGEVDTPILDKRPVPVSEERRQAILRPEDVGEAVLFAATRPARVCIRVMVIEPR